jgi:hypothetical protein
LNFLPNLVLLLKDATRPIGLEIPVMQPRSRVVQPQDKQHRPIASL